MLGRPLGISEKVKYCIDLNLGFLFLNCCPRIIPIKHLPVSLANKLCKFIIQKKNLTLNGWMLRFIVLRIWKGRLKSLQQFKFQELQADFNSPKWSKTTSTRDREWAHEYNPETDNNTFCSGNKAKWCCFSLYWYSMRSKVRVHK